MPRFLILTPARSGSTSLRMSLNKHSDCLCHGELLGKKRVLGYVRSPEREELTLETRQNDPERFLHMAFESGRTEKMRGLKVLTTHFYMEHNSYLLQRVLQDKPRVILLWRRDLVRRFQSHCLLLLGKQMTKQNFAETTLENIRQDAQMQVDMIRWCLMILQAYGVDQVLHLTLEDLIADEASALNRVTGFLDLPAENLLMVKDQRTLENEKSAPRVAIPEVFSDPSLDSLRDVDLETVLAQGRL